MYLALHDAGKLDDIEAVAKALVVLVRRHRAGSGPAEEIEDIVELILDYESDHGGSRPPIEKILGGRPFYMIFQYASAAFNESGKTYYVGGGDHLVCDVIRRRVPLATEDFHKTGSMTGCPKQSVELAARCWPNKTLLTAFGRESEPDWVLPQPVD